MSEQMSLLPGPSARRRPEPYRDARIPQELLRRFWVWWRAGGAGAAGPAKAGERAKISRPVTGPAATSEE